MARRSTKIRTPAGSVSRATRRVPSDAWSQNDGRSPAGDGAGHLGRERGGDRHGQQAVGEHEERERVEVGAGVAGARVGEVAHDDDRDLVGDDVAERPARQRQQAAHGRVAELQPRPPAHAGRADGGDQHDAPSPRCRRWRRGRASSAAGRSSARRPASSRVAGRVGQRQQRGDDDQVGQDRAPRGGEEAPPRVEQRVGQAGRPVEEDLQQEDPREQRADLPELLGVDDGRRVERVEPEDQRRQQRRRSP